MHTDPQYHFVSRDSNHSDYHEDTYMLTYPDGGRTKITRQTPKRVGKTKRDK